MEPGTEQIEGPKAFSIAVAQLAYAERWHYGRGTGEVPGYGTRSYTRPAAIHLPPPISSGTDPRPLHATRPGERRQAAASSIL